MDSIRIIPPRIHGVLDYVVALTLIVAPLALGFSDPLARWASVAAGAGLVIYSLMTSYGPSLFRIVPFKLHLVFDFAAGATFVALALVFSGAAFAYYLTMGIAIMAVVLTTRTSEERAAVLSAA